MPIIAHLLAPIALLLPAATVDVSSYDGPVLVDTADAQWPAASVPADGPLSVSAIDPGSFIRQGLVDDVWMQVRIEQRMIIRIAPRLPGQMVTLPARPRVQPRFVERKTAK